MKNKNTLFLLFSLLILTGEVFAQYTIPWATKQPAWVFPIWLESGDGQKDTLYTAYDPTATYYWGSSNSDTAFGEKWLLTDTTKFYAYLGYKGSAWKPDTILKVLVDTFGGGGTVLFRNARYPLKMYWDDSLFYSDSLPYFRDTAYPDTLPRAIGAIACGDAHPPDYVNCGLSDGANFVLSRDPNKYYEPNSCDFTPPSALPYYSGAPCSVTDSIVWYGDTSITTVGYVSGFSFSIREYRRYWGIKENAEEQEKFSFYPNPFSDFIRIVSREKKKFSATIHDITGRGIFYAQTVYGEQSLDLKNLPKGIYVIKIFCDNKFYRYKIIKQ